MLRLLLPVLVSLILLATEACSLLYPQASAWQEATARSVKPAWLSGAEARAQAQKEATDEARRRIWSDLMPREVAEDLTFEQLVIIDPVFESKLRGEIAALRPEKVVETPDGEVIVVLRMDRNKALELARRCVPQ